MNVKDLITNLVNKGFKITIPIYGVKDKKEREIKQWRGFDKKVEECIKNFKEDNKEKDV